MKALANRRTILTSVAAAPLLALPAIALPYGDAELIALGKQFDELEIMHAAACVRWQPQWEAVAAAVHDYSEQIRDGGCEWSDQEHDKIVRRAEAENPAAQPHPDKISNTMDPLMRRIMDLPAHTIEGLKVKARTARFACEHFWDLTDKASDWDHLFARKAIDAILSF